ncbi:hypothetical protein M9H77_27470 [Catharanthus roseus]|uniref:Uncharacterized protein n=1 Tax=Catharanthus roseus TaxID=4058 RepID=A0ACC0ACK1_CATRO|nr:hypothetical protein M9H77_27470 [Catharanthus roseus]
MSDLGDNSEREISSMNQMSDEEDNVSLPPCQEDSISSYPGKGTKRKLTEPCSEVWKHFTKFTNDCGEQKACCHYCIQEYAASSFTNGTSMLKNHMTTLHKNTT